MRNGLEVWSQHHPRQSIIRLVGRCAHVVSTHSKLESSKMPSLKLFLFEVALEGTFLGLPPSIEAFEAGGDDIEAKEGQERIGNK